MTNRIALITLGLVAFVFPMTAQNQRGMPFSLVVRPIMATVQLGSPVVIELTTTNNLTRPIKLGKSNPGIEYQIDVRDANGQPVSQTALYKQLQNPSSIFRLTSQILKAGESATEQFNIADFFDFSSLGTYSIQVQRPVPRQIGSGVVKSNIIEVTMTPRDQ